MALGVLLSSTMARILNRQFGPLDYEHHAVLEFPGGLPGFEQHQCFVLIEPPPLAPLVFLQSLDSPDLCFPAVPLRTIDPHYELAMTPEDLRLLDPQNTTALITLALLATPEDGPPTANLLAPVVIDPRTRRAVQAVRNDGRYSHRHPLAARETSCS